MAVLADQHSEVPRVVRLTKEVDWWPPGAGEWRRHGELVFTGGSISGWGG